MDIVADVLKQANPAKLKIASQHLEGLAKGMSIKNPNGQFRLPIKSAGIEETLINQVRSKKDQSRVPGEGGDEVDLKSVAKKDSKKAAMRALETVLATKMVEGMMPKDQSRLYGEGTAGEIWRGLHIEAMGKALASQGLFETTKDDANRIDQRDEMPGKAKAIVPFAG
jgi:peptidoglycan hydrolase FlgJ